jgi:Winged helix DNA-binding domain
MGDCGLLVIMAKAGSATSAPVLSDRTLNRTMLLRQQLLARSEEPAAELIDRLVGLQAQAPLAPYVALWSRLEGFRTDELSELMRSRAYVRGHAMRSTIHLLSAEDFLELRALSDAAVALNLSGQAPWAKAMRGQDHLALAADLRTVLADGPLARTELARRLSGRWDMEVADAAASAVMVLTGCVQAPPRGVWGQGGAVTWATVQQWLGAELPDPPPSPLAFLARYLAAFGPASVADMRVWSGWKQLRELIAASNLQLRRFRSEHGNELLDLPDAPLAEPELAAPVRFLPEFDNVYFSYRDRERINPYRFAVPLAPGNGAAIGTLLVDGVFCGDWRRKLSSSGEGVVLAVRAYRSLSAAEHAEVNREGLALLRFLAPDAAPEINVTDAS